MQPTQTTPITATPAPVAAPIQGGAGTGGAVVGVPVPPLMPGVPRTAAEVRALRTAREALSEQMISAQGRRDEMVAQLRQATGVDRAGLEQRLAITDARLAQLEADLAVTGRQLAAAPAELVNSTAGTSVPPQWYDRLDSGDVTAIASVFSIFVLAPMAFAMARLMWRRATVPASRPSPETTQRLERMELAIDAIAVEVERISEGQRFVTRLLGEGNSLQSLGRTQQAETMPIARGGQ